MRYGDNGWEPEGGGPDLGKLSKELSEKLQGRLKLILGGIAAIVVLILATQAIYVVQPGERAVIRTFGKETAQTEQGLHFHLPLVQSVDVVNIEKVRRIQLGVGDENTEALMLTGDENLVDADMVVQYKVVDPSKFLFAIRDPEEVLSSTAEVAIRTVVGGTSIDEILTSGKDMVQTKTRAVLTELMARYESGMAITEVKLQAVNPPLQVKEAFHDVVRAREEREKLINEAKAFQAEIVPRARGEAHAAEREAEAYKEERVLRATGDAERFSAVVAEYKKSPRVTRDRLYLETLESVLARTPGKTIVDDRLASGTVPLLRIGKQKGAGTL